MVTTKIVRLELKPEHRKLAFPYTGRKGKWRSWTKPPVYTGLFLKETEKSFVIVLLGTRRDKSGNLRITKARLKKLQEDLGKGKRWVYKKYYNLVDEIEVDVVNELLTHDWEYFRQLGLALHEAKT